MTLAFFTVSALDLLGGLEPHTTPDERESYIRWIYSCQHPEGGFRGFPGTKFGGLRNDENKVWDPANVPATYFALSALVVLGDDLERVKRRECLVWLNRMQRPDGSFGETMGENGRIEGGQDTRFGYCASVVRWILRGNLAGPVEGVPDIDVDSLVTCIVNSETYDGGISDGQFHEAHAGFTFCAIAILYLVDRLPSGMNGISNQLRGEGSSPTGLTNLELTVRWLVSRQTATLGEQDEPDALVDEPDAPTAGPDSGSFIKMKSIPSNAGQVSGESRPPSHYPIQWAGFNGRCNKIADTCYAWWVGGSLDLLNRLHLIDKTACRRYLLDKTQHIAGGFGKLPGDPPDIYHAYLGLAALAVMGEPILKPFAPAGCFSMDTRDRIEALPWRRKLLRENYRQHRGSADSAHAPQGARKQTKEPTNTTSNEVPSGLSYAAISGG